MILLMFMQFIYLFIFYFILFFFFISSVIQLIRGGYINDRYFPYIIEHIKTGLVDGKTVTLYNGQKLVILDNKVTEIIYKSKNEWTIYHY